MDTAEVSVRGLDKYYYSIDPSENLEKVMSSMKYRHLALRVTGTIATVMGILLIYMSLQLNGNPALLNLINGTVSIRYLVVGSTLFYFGIFVVLFASAQLKVIIKKYIISLICVLITLVGLEILIRVIIPQPIFDSRLPLLPNYNVSFEVDLHGISSPIQYSTNSWGFRGDEPPENWETSFTIITIGGSTTESKFVDDAKTWPALLQTSLRKQNESVWVGNVGLDGHSTYGHLLVMEQIIHEVRPDLVIFLVGINDLGISLSDNPSSGNRSDMLETPILLKSQLYRLLSQVLFVLLGETVTARSAHTNFKPSIADPDQLTELPDDLHEVLHGLDSYKRNLNELIDIGKELDINMVFLTQPLLFDDTEYWQAIDGNLPWVKNRKVSITASTLWNLLDIYNETLLAVCEERRVYCYDLAKSVPHRSEYFYDNIHFNDAGSALVAKEVEKAVQNFVDQHSESFD